MDHRGQRQGLIHYSSFTSEAFDGEEDGGSTAMVIRGRKFPHPLLYSKSGIIDQAV